jgi:hypothetical protein
VEVTGVPAVVTERIDVSTFSAETLYVLGFHTGRLSRVLPFEIAERVATLIALHRGWWETDLA